MKIWLENFKIFQILIKNTEINDKLHEFSRCLICLKKKIYQKISIEKMPLNWTVLNFQTRVSFKLEKSKGKQENLFNLFTCLKKKKHRNLKGVAAFSPCRRNCSYISNYHKNKLNMRKWDLREWYNLNIIWI